MWRLVSVLGFVSTLLVQPPAMPAIGKPAPDFRFSRVRLADGSSGAPDAHTPAALKGKVVVLDFFATYCQPCVDAIPHTNALIDSTRELPVVYLAVANEKPEVIEEFLAKRPFRAAIAYDDGEFTYGRYFVKSLPFVAIIDTQGRISRFTHPARISREMIAAAVQGQ